ncbi:hypothetical protein GPECTOR_34g725 [Gonium pectorale]|uniref:Uncharacterized protein n=1 Tax=Gonium pectorale TaxID=33097 RepID=A0A150GCJ1_GONPE|nr:hypothetical protein GPECTOR_34g725 [Gonium pectorale]|eukprot:KXZ47566.1 hypothetical protein GPECTOR_34g725 [Gonium pectorale]
MGNPGENSSPLDQANKVVTEARATIEKGVADLSAQADEALRVVASQVVTGGAVVADVVREGAAVANKYADEGKAGSARDRCPGGLDLIHSNTYISYPVLVTGGLLILPGTRRLLYRATLGRLRSTENIIRGSEGKVEGLRVKLTDFGEEAKKLQERMVSAEEEYLRGRSKLKATRLELQRLASVVTKSERAAAGVLDDLRTIKKVDKAVQLRAEAASQVSALKAQRSALQQWIYRIASKDI